MRLLPVLFAASYIQSNNVPLLTVLPSCLPKKKYLPKRVYFIHCWSTVGSRTLNCYQQPGLRGCKNWAYEVKEKQKKPQFESASNQSHLNWKVLAMKASSFHRISNQNKLLGPWETMGNGLAGLLGRPGVTTTTPVLGFPFQTDGYGQHSEFVDISFQMLL